MRNKALNRKVGRLDQRNRWSGLFTAVFICASPVVRVSVLAVDLSSAIEDLPPGSLT
jgi:hypothetical protein